MNIDPVAFIEYQNIVFIEDDIILRNGDFVEIREQLYAIIIGFGLQPIVEGE